MKTRTSFKKGDLVRLNPSACFTTRSGGKLEYPLTHYANDHAGVVDGFYILSKSEIEELSPRYIGTDSAGEPKIVPRERYIPLKRESVYTVIKARTSATRGFRKVSGLSLILDTQTGKHVYVSRNLLEKV